MTFESRQGASANDPCAPGAAEARFGTGLQDCECRRSAVGCGDAGVPGCRLELRGRRFALRRCLAAAVADRRIAVDPAVDVPVRSERATTPRFLSQAEVERLVAEVPDCYRALVLAGGYGGLRWGEAVGLTRVSVDVQRSRLTFHGLRHSFVAILVAAGCNVREVSEWAGHNSVAFTSTRYGGLFDDDSAAAVDRLDALLGGGGRAPMGDEGSAGAPWCPCADGGHRGLLHTRYRGTALVSPTGFEPALPP